MSTPTPEAPTAADDFPITPTTRVRRGAKRATYDRATVHAILDEALVCHVGAVVNGRPWVQPNLHWRIGDELFLHGSSKNGLINALLEGAEACVTVSLIDGLVLARSAFHHSVNYRSVAVFGRARHVTDAAEKMAALETMMEKFAPGRWPDIRPPSPQEFKATAVIALPLREVSAKVRAGGPVDDAEDYALPVWAGVVPLRTVRDTPIKDEATAPPED